MLKLDYGQRPVSAHCRLRRIGGALVAVCTLASILVAPVMAQAGQGGRRLALLIGVGTFLDSTFNSLTYSRNDVEAMRKWLTSPQGGGFQAGDVTVLLDKSATRAAIVRQAQRLAAQAGPEDLVLLYFSTHGFTTTDRRVGIISYDTRATGRLDANGGPIVYRDQALTRDDLDRFLDGLPAQRRVVIIDVCYSGQLAGEQRGQGPVEHTLQADKLANGPEKITMILASSLGSERAWESQEFKSSIFTYNLLKGLKQSNGDLLAAFNLACKETERQSRTEKGICQTPYLTGQPPGGKFFLSPPRAG